MVADHTAALIPALYLLAAVLVPVAGYRRPAVAFYVALLGCASVLAVSLVGLREVMAGRVLHYHMGGWTPPIGIELVLDPLSAYMNVIIACVALVAMVYSRQPVPRELEGRAVPFYSLAMVCLGGLTGMTLTGDLFNLYVFLEISSLAVYAIISIGDRRAPISAFRYLILGTAGAGFYLLGVAFIYMSTGTLNMADVTQVLGAAPSLTQHPPVVAGFALIILGVCLKMGMFPIHHWLPDAYTRASSAATVLIAPIGTKVAAYVLIRTADMLPMPDLFSALGWLAALGIVAASVLAVSQTNIKRMLAYSSVANIGYITMGITLANPLALAGALLHVLNHALMKLVLFAAAGGISSKMGTLDIRRLRGLSTVMPITAAIFLLASLSMVGIPPTGGFFSKLYLIMGAIDAQAWAFVAVIIGSSLLALVYLFRVVRVAFFKPFEASSEAKDAPTSLPKMTEMPPSMLIPTAIVAVVIVLVGIYNGTIVASIIDGAVADLAFVGSGGR